MAKMTEHTLRKFDTELQEIRRGVLQMGGLVEAQVTKALDGLRSGDIELLEAVIQGDKEVNLAQIKLDDACTHIIARQQPAAGDLRLVLATIKAASDLERIGDEAKKIAKGARRVHEHGQLTLPRATEVRHVADEAISMLRRSLDAFARLDVALANEVIHADAKVDTEFKALVRQLITYMMEDPRTITTAIDIVWICRSIERIGDHAKNIAEHIIHIAEGRDVRHSKEA